MKFRPITWFVLSVVLFIAAWVFWQRGEQWRKTQPQRAATNSVTAKASGGGATAKSNSASIVTGPVIFPSNLIVSQTASNLLHQASPKDYRVSNTTESFDTLALKDTAILLRNAWIDTASGRSLPIPADLRAAEDPGSYIVQSKGTITPAFRQQLMDAGATVISYIPNNAYMVRVTPDGARRLAGSPGVQAVMPNEPVLKLEPELMSAALGLKANPSGKILRVTILDDLKDSATAGIAGLGAVVVGHDRTPFGSQLFVQVPLSSDNTIQKLAKMNSVQGIEMYHERVLMNDLTRERVRASADTVTNANYLGLTGSNVLVNVNDTGGYASHPDLTNRLFGVIVTNQFGKQLFNTYEDFNGHGTHVSGIIMSSGAHGPVGSVLTNFNSVSNANFRGMAPAASVFVLPFNSDLSDNLDSFGTDASLAEWAAKTNLLVFGHTNTLISNNSWGYGSFSYNSSAAIFDGAARDSLPDVPGSQPVLFIFAAGNSGGAGDLCFTAEYADTINSPATMKNGIAVGAIENLRNIGSNAVLTLGKTNLYYTCDNCDLQTNNDAFLGRTDSSNQVAGFSSRGNSGITSKSIGRFKPDLVAPGSFAISTRPPGSNWNAAAYYNPTNTIDGYKFKQLILNGNRTNSFPSLLVPDNTVEISLIANPTLILTNDLLIYASTSMSPSSDPTAQVGLNQLIITNIGSSNCFGDEWFVEVVNASSNKAAFDFTARVLATNKGTILTVMSNMNESLDPNELYRFESGTSMAAPVVSGLAALMQEFFEQRLGRTNSPALMKALLINGARSVSSAYHLQIDPLANQQGWGLVNIQNSIPALLNTLSNTTDEASWPIRFFDQSPTNALATGQSYTYALSITNNRAIRAPLRVTLVWTDPPGNPAATINLVNDLDLIVTNLDTGEVYFGNNFSGGRDFSDVSMLIDSNSVPVSVSNFTNDFINNVENVYISAPIGTNYAICVSAKRVNVNAVIANTNDVVQDYALVIASGDSSITNAFSLAPAVLTTDTNSVVTFMNIGSDDSTNSLTSHRTRGIVLESQRVGANSSLIVSTNGTNIQWRFYAVTNATTFTNAVFSIFSAPTLAVARNISDPFAVPQDLGPNSGFPLGRNISADLDLFVTTNSALVNLDDLAVAQAWKSVDRFSDEAILLTNSTQGTVYYIGVKSEDQQAGEFSLGVVFTEFNPYQVNSDGSVTVELPFASYDIPDGSPQEPKGAYSIGLPAFPGRNFDIGGVVVSNKFTHQRFGDLAGILTFGSTQIFLNNHNEDIQGQQQGTVINSYDDLNILPVAPPNATTSDGPGSLADLLGKKANSSSLKFYMIDNSPNNIGRLEGVLVTLFPQNTNGLIRGTSGRLFSGTVAPGQTRYGALVVPATAVSLTLKVSIPDTTQGPLEMYVRRDDGSSPRLPGPSNYDYTKTINAPGGSLTIGRGDLPPLIAGTYIIAIHNNIAPTTTFDVFFDMTLDLGATSANELVSTNIQVLADQVFTNSLTSMINVNLRTNEIVSDVRVGVRIDHPRVSDLVLHLVSPEGTSVLLSENRGHLSTNGFGLGTKPGELAYTSFSEDTDVAFIPIKFAANSNYLEFIQPTLIATNNLQDTLSYTPVTLAQSSGDAAESSTSIPTGSTSGSILVRYQMYSVPDSLKVYYEGNVLYDSGLVSGSNNITIPYSGATDVLTIVINEGGNTETNTVWDYSVSFLRASSTNENQVGTGVAILGNNLFLSGISQANETNGIAARLDLPMQDNAFPVWDINYPGVPGTNRFNAVAVTSEGVYMVGDGVSLTTDDMSDGAKQTKGIVVKFPLGTQLSDTNDFYGSIWHVQMPAVPGAFTNGGYEQLHAITATVEGGSNVLYVAGDGQANGTNNGRLFIAKLDTNGTNLWTTNDLTTSVTTNYSSGRAITTMNGNIYVAGGNADSGVTNAYLVKYDPTGNQVWARISSYTGEFKGIAAYGNSIYTVGMVETAGVSNCFVQKWDENGASVWTNQVSINGVEDVLNAVVAYGDRLYAVGSTMVNSTNHDAILLELRQDTGVLVTNATYNGITTYDGGFLGDDVARAIATDGFDLYIVGETRHLTNRTDSDVLLLRYRIKNDYLPEEPLSLFTGEYANSVISGTNTNGWRLTIWDNRADTTVSTGKLIAWQLQLTLAPTNNTADILTHDVPFFGTLSEKNPIRYFIVNVPYTASKATFLVTNLSGGSLNLYFSQTGLPIDPTTRYLLLSGVPDGAAVLSSSTLPELIPGQRCYLGVEDTGSGTNDFALEVKFDSSATTFMAGGSSASGSQAAGPAGGSDLYQFIISPNSPPTAFQLRNLTGNAEVFLRRGNLASSSSYDLHQSFLGTNFGQVVIRTNGSMPDVSGTWYASVGKLTTNSIAYTVVVTNANRSPVFGSLATRAVTKGDLLSFTAPVSDPDGAGQQLTFSLAPGAPAGASINSTSGLFTWTPSAAQGPSSNVVTINVTDNGVPPMATNGTFSIIVNERVPVFGTPAMVSGKLQMVWSSLTGQSYEVQMTTNLVNWTTIATNSASGSSTTYLDPNSQGKAERFYRIHPIP